MAGYTRQSTITDGNVGLASLWNDEYNALLNAFAAGTGHKHDGTAAEGGYIPIIADSDKHNYVVVNGDTIEFWIDDTGTGTPVKQFTLTNGALTPETDSDIDLGSATKAFKDFYVDTISVGGTITVATVDINGGAIDGTTIGAAVAAAGTFTTLTAASATINGNISVTGTVDGRDIATDGTKLDGIASGAEVNESSFKTITLSSTGTGVVSGGDVVADTDADTLTIVAGDDITITNDPTTDKVTIKATVGPTNAVVGPASATDNALPRYDGATGKLVQDSGITVDDTNNVTGVNDLTCAGFTSTGIDDNATNEVMNLSDATLRLGDATSGEIFGIALETVTDGRLDISGDVSTSAGGNIQLFGSTNADGGDIRFRSGTNIFANWDESQGSLTVSTGTGAKTDALTIDGSQVVQLDVGQLKFPATQNASADANTLDDYEEGTWTATIADAGTGGNTSTTGAGTYTKWGNQVRIIARIVNIDTTTLTGTNDLYIVGLPFDAVALASTQFNLGHVGVSRASQGTNCVSIKSSITQNSNAVRIREDYNNAAANFSYSLVNQFSDDLADIDIDITYFTN